MSTFLQLAGIVSIIVGCALIAPPVAFIVGGILVTLVGVAAEGVR
jgi:hypothetical protein